MGSEPSTRSTRSQLADRRDAWNLNFPPISAFISLTNKFFIRSWALSLHLHLWWMLTGGLREKKTAVEIFEIFDRQKVAIARSGRYAGFHSLQLAIHITSFADN